MWVSLALRRGRCERRWGLAGIVVGLAGASQRSHWASLRLAGSSLGVVGVSQGPLLKFLGVCRAALGVAGASEETLWASLGPRRGRSGRRWRVVGDALGLAGPSHKLLWASLEPPRSRSGRRWGFGNVGLQFHALSHCNACSGFQCFLSLQCFMLVSMLCFT